MVEKTAGITVYLMEELTDARLRCEQLKGYIDRAMRLVSESTQKNHIYEVAADLLYAIPDALFRLDKALDATALAASRLDYEELKQELRPEKVQELESVLKDVRIRHFDRRAPKVQEMTMRKLATGSDVAQALRHIANVIDDQQKRGESPSTSKIAQALQTVIAAMSPSADEARRSRFEEGKPADPTENMDEADAKKWKTEHEKNKDNFKSADDAWGPGNSLKEPWVVGPGTGGIRLSEEQLRSRFEEGKPADPTENMSAEDAKTWKEEHEKNKDNFKSALLTPPPENSTEEQVGMGVEELMLYARKAMAAYAQGNTGKLFYSLLGLVDGLGVIGSAYGVPVLPLVMLRKNLATLSSGRPMTNFASEESKVADFETPPRDQAVGLYSTFESIKTHAILAMRKYEGGQYKWAIQELAWLAGELGPVLKSVGAQEELSTRLMLSLSRGKQQFDPDTLPPGLRLSRFESGKPADPTENMSEEDAAKWKDMNDEYGDKFKG